MNNIRLTNAGFTFFPGDREPSPVSFKRTAAVIIACIAAFSAAACGHIEEAVPAEEVPAGTVSEGTASVETVTEESRTEAANPWVEITEEKANLIYSKLFKAPDGATNVIWSEMPSAADETGFPGTVLQMAFTLDGMDFTARIQATDEEKADISGMYYDWTEKDTGTLKGWGGDNMPAAFYRYKGDKEAAALCCWYDIEAGYAYTLGVTAPDLEGVDIRTYAEAIYAPEHEPGYNMPDDSDEPSIDITGCDTFTQIVDKLPAGWGYANAGMGGTDVLLVTDYTYDNNGGEGDPFYATTKADIFYYDAEGVPTFAGCINSSGTAYPLTEYGDRIYTGGHHFVRVYTFQAGRIVIDEEAYAVYDSDGKATYYVLSDTHDTGAGEDGLVDDGTRLDEMFTEFMEGQTIEFSVVG